MEDNRRLKELKLMLYLNYMAKTEDVKPFRHFIKVLGCLSDAINKEAHKAFIKMVESSIANNFLGASDKTLAAMLKRNFKVSKAQKLLRCSGTTFYERFGSYYDRDFIDEEYLKSLKPVINTLDGQSMIDTLCSFIDNFYFELGNEEHDLKDNTRTLELEFWLIYDHLIASIRSATVCDRFIKNICDVFEIDYNSVFQLRSSLHLITRIFPHFSLNNRYFMQEFVTLYMHKGLSKGTIGSKVFHRESNYLYNGTNKKFTPIADKDIIWQYSPTVNWDNINKESVKKFINVLHNFIRYGIK